MPKPRVVFAEPEDPRIQKAVAVLAADGVMEPLLVSADPVPDGVRRIDPQAVATEPLVAAMRKTRPETKPSIAARLLRKPLYLAGAMLAAGDADAMVAGVANPTRRVIEAAAMTVGMADGIATPSSFFMMELPDRAPLLFADCALNVAPSAQELADIALSTARSAAVLLADPPRVAFLSFSTHASGAGASVDLVTEAVGLARERAPDLVLDGPLQGDAALSAAIAAKKGVMGPVAGQANVLIFPSLDAGNIAYKLMQELAGAQALGPVLQGFARPVCDLSRGASVDDIVDAARLTLSLA